MSYHFNKAYIYTLTVSLFEPGEDFTSEVGLERLLVIGRRPLYMVIAMIIGAVVGLAVGPDIAVIKPLGDVFVMLLKFIVGPLIFVSIVYAFVTIQTYGRLGKILGGFLVYWAVFAVLAASIGYTTAMILKPGVGLQLTPKEPIQAKPLSPVDIVMNYMPSNLIKHFLELNTMALIIAAILIGIALVAMRSTAPREYEFLKNLLGSLLALIYKFIDLVLWYAPIGIFALMANLAGTVGTLGLATVGKMIATHWVAYSIILFVVHPLYMALILRINPIQYWRKIYPAMITAFSTCSSSATLPVTMRVTKTLGVPSDAADLILPLAATINMQAVAAEMPIYAVWVAQMYNISLTPVHTAVALMMGVFGAAACAGVPGGGIMIAAATMTALGFPLEPVAWIAGVYPAIDVINTMLNVTGDPLGVITVSKFVLKEFDINKFNAPPK